jgi:hypothetical protein
LGGKALSCVLLGFEVLSFLVCNLPLAFHQTGNAIWETFLVFTSHEVGRPFLMNLLEGVRGGLNGSEHTRKRSPTVHEAPVHLCSLRFFFPLRLQCSLRYHHRSRGIGSCHCFSGTGVLEPGIWNIRERKPVRIFRKDVSCQTSCVELDFFFRFFSSNNNIPHRSIHQPSQQNLDRDDRVFVSCFQALFCLSLVHTWTGRNLAFSS